jgi:pilus assembly protein CpaE
MRGPVRALIALEAGVAGDYIRELIPESSGIQIARMTTGLDEGWDHLHDAAADIFVVACDRHSDAALELVRASASERPHRPVVLLAQGSANGFVRKAFESGADDIVVLPAPDSGELPSDDVVFALQKAVARKSAPAEGGATQATMICVLGPKGGIGKTLTSCNLAVSLASRSERVVLVDLDLQFGDLGLALGITPQKTSYDLAVAGGTLDADKVEAYLETHSSGAKVLLAPSRPDQAGAVTVDFLAQLYPVLRQNYDYVIVDTPPGFTPEVIASIDASSQICMVGMLDALSLKNTKLGLETLDLMGYDLDRIRIVLNRADSNVGITHNDVVTVLGRPPDVLVPSHRDITRSVNEGQPIAASQKRSEAAKAFHSLAEIYSSARPGKTKPKQGRSLLARGRR